VKEDTNSKGRTISTLCQLPWFEETNVRGLYMALPCSFVSFKKNISIEEENNFPLNISIHKFGILYKEDCKNLDIISTSHSPNKSKIIQHYRLEVPSPNSLTDAVRHPNRVT